MAAREMAEGSQNNGKLPRAALGASERVAANRPLDPGTQSLQWCCLSVHLLCRLCAGNQNVTPCTQQIQLLLK